METTFSFSRCTTAEVDTLVQLGRETFIHSYEHLNAPDNLHNFFAYVERAFHPHRIAEEIQRPASEFWLARLGEQAVGYAKFNLPAAHTEAGCAGGLEIERIYVHPDFQQRGLGRRLLQVGQARARAAGLEVLSLGVWERNPAAITFYEKQGFYRQGQHIFLLGDDPQIDYIMRKELPVPTDIIFDLGGVLIDWNPRHLYRKLCADEEEMEYFLTHIATSDWNEEQDAGRSLAAATEALVAAHPDWADLIRAFYGRWPEMLAGPIEGTLSILQELRGQARYRLTALTNWSAETWPIAWERYMFLRWFDHILMSGQEQLRKPDSRFYALLRTRCQIDFERAVFIDDNLRNVEAARAEGLDSILFREPEELRTELRRRGLEV